MQYLDPVPVSTCLGDGAGNDFRLTEQYMNCLEGKNDTHNFILAFIVHLEVVVVCLILLVTGDRVGCCWINVVNN